MFACGALSPETGGSSSSAVPGGASDLTDALGFSLAECTPALLAQRRLCAASDARRRPFWAAAASASAGAIAESGLEAVLLRRAGAKPGDEPSARASSAPSSSLRVVPPLAPLGWSGVLPRGAKALLRKGVPAEMRSRVWLALSGGERRREEAGPGAYDALARDADVVSADGGDAAAASPAPGSPGAIRQSDASQIELDLHRTFPSNAWVSSAEGQACLRRVLHAFARRGRFFLRHLL